MRDFAAGRCCGGCRARLHPSRLSLEKSRADRQEVRTGEMAEWLKAHAWKACVRQNRTVGSNPTLSATDPVLLRSPPPVAQTISACPANTSAATSGLGGWRAAAFDSLKGLFSPKLCTLPI